MKGIKSDGSARERERETAAARIVRNDTASVRVYRFQSLDIVGIGAFAFGRGIDVEDAAVIKEELFIERRDLPGGRAGRVRGRFPDDWRKLHQQRLAAPPFPGTI